jgi:uncharacterized membrane protein
MLINIALIIVCVLVAVIALPLLLKLIPPNPVYGINTRHTRESDSMWFEVNRFAGAAFLVAAGLGAIILMSSSGRSWWVQLLVLLVLFGIAVGATLWFERKLGKLMDGSG